jgi:RNA polymerase-binding transcription factor DksA
MTTSETARAQLRERLSELADRAGRIERDLRRVLERDGTEQAISLENDEVLEGLDELTRGEVRDIWVALRRIDAGTYGTCTTCGAAIAPERLAALPSTPFCVRCARAMPGPVSRTAS